MLYCIGYPHHHKACLAKDFPIAGKQDNPRGRLSRDPPSRKYRGISNPDSTSRPVPRGCGCLFVFISFRFLWYQPSSLICNSPLSSTFFRRGTHVEPCREARQPRTACKRVRNVFQERKKKETSPKKNTHGGYM